ncbi:hypothetical protein FVEG_12919 [Fusarium verticillioides 7600]|uniref:Uncharacterized protein n=1 Tax=Gibberella moniliformis (strain M3125 / FGSC 7600) TaxID=334819 RepID=W7MTL1_GIBM7|nr:hypothetical protein FVEG_12919 [Fusarium verticillioides 7600]EWG54808.1 hypothetical protein FVEG_12919 [Fusarium verticillioides 7600]
MSARTQLPYNKETNPSKAQLYIVLNPPLNFNLKRDKIDFKVPRRWMIAVFNPVLIKWLTADGRQDEARYALIKGDAPPENSKLFEVAKIPVSKLGDVEARIRSVLPDENPLGEMQFNRGYVREVLNNLVDGGIIGEHQARDTFLAVEAYCLQLNKN